MKKWVKTAFDLAMLAGGAWLWVWVSGAPFSTEGFTLSVAVCALLAANGKEKAA